MTFCLVLEISLNGIPEISIQGVHEEKIIPEPHPLRFILLSIYTFYGASPYKKKEKKTNNPFQRRTTISDVKLRANVMN